MEASCAEPQSRQAKAEAAHIARCRDLASGSPVAKGSGDHTWDSGKCMAARRPNPLLGAHTRSTQDVQATGGKIHKCTPHFLQTENTGMDESVRSIFDAVLQEHVAYRAIFGDTDSDLEVCSFAGSDGDRVTELCQRAETLIREMGASVSPAVAPTETPPPQAPREVSLSPRPVVAITRTPSSAPPTSNLGDEEGKPQPFQETAALLSELLPNATPPPTILASPGRPAALSDTLQALGSGDAEDPSTWPGMQSCEETDSLFRELGGSMTPPVTPPVATRALAPPDIILVGSACEDDPSSWPDLQPWLRGMCASVPLVGEDISKCDDRGVMQFSDLQFRISRLELQVSQISAANEKTSDSEEVAQLRKHVETAQSELEATRREARETNEQLRRLMQHTGISGPTSVVRAMPQWNVKEASDTRLPGTPGNSVFRSLSVASQDSQVHALHRVPSFQSTAVERSPVQLPRARSVDSAARRQFYPLGTARVVTSQSSLHSSSKEKLASKRQSFPSSGTRAADVPVRMCTSEQLMQAVKQRPLWLQKAVDTPRCSRPGKTARQPLRVQIPRANC